MSKKKRVILIISIGLMGIILIGLVLSIVTKFWYNPFKGVNKPGFGYYTDYTKVLSLDEIKEDLRQLKTDLAEVHPATMDGLPPELEAAFAAAGQINREMTVGEFSLIVSELVCMLGDAHTSVHLGVADRHLPIGIKVIDNKFYVLGGRNLNPGDELLSLGGVATEDIMAFAKQVIPAENPYWRNHLIASVLTQSALTQMGAEINEKRRIDAEIRRNGETIVVPLEFGFTYDIPQPSQDKEFYPSNSADYGYYLDQEKSFCHFKLSKCNYTEDYIQFLKTMFQGIMDKRIENIIVDLRGNPGGNSWVVNEFLKYIDIEDYKSYCYTRRMSRAAAAQKGYIINWGSVTYKHCIRKNSRAEGLIFAGQIYALIDNGTFSSGNYFGVILADNGIGTIIGEPSGNAPNCYGDVLYFQLKNSKLIYSISYTQWMRPNLDRAEDDALYPHYPVTFTIDDYINQRDLAMEEALRLIQGGN